MANQTISAEAARLAIIRECDALKELLLAKNAAYGNSVFDPEGIFSKLSPREQILVRIDDKIKRIKRGQAAGEDTARDLAGYFLLLRVYDSLIDAPAGIESAAPAAPEGWVHVAKNGWLVPDPEYGNLDYDSSKYTLCEGTDNAPLRGLTWYSLKHSTLGEIWYVSLEYHGDIIDRLKAVVPD